MDAGASAIHHGTSVTNVIQEPSGENQLAIGLRCQLGSGGSSIKELGEISFGRNRWQTCACYEIRTITGYSHRNRICEISGLSQSLVLIFRSRQWFEPVRNS
jgi:hypothetical protein